MKLIAVVTFHALIIAADVDDKKPAVPGQLSLVKPPDNDYGMEGSNVTLTCECSAPSPACRIFWSEYTMGYVRQISDDRFVIPSHPKADRYSIIQERGTQFDLVIDPVDSSDAGMYSCFDVFSVPTEQMLGFASLTVIKSDPVCTTTVPAGGVIDSGQSYNKSCRIDKNGTQAMQMSWAGPAPFIVDVEETNETLTTTITFTAHSGMHQQRYTCLTNFSTVTEAPPNTATNTPTYRHEHLFEIMSYQGTDPTTITTPSRPPLPDGPDIQTPHMETVFNGSLVSMAIIADGTSPITAFTDSAVKLLTDSSLSSSEIAVLRKLLAGREEELLNTNISMRCLNMYGREFRQSFRDVIRRANAEVGGGSYCARSPLMTFYPGDTMMTAISGGIRMTFVAWLLSNRHYPMFELERCSWDVGDYVRNFTNWRIPIIPGIYNCPTVSFDPDTFNKLSMSYICRIKEPERMFNMYSK